MATSVFSLHLKGVRFFGIHRHHPGDNQNVLGFFGMIGCYKGFNAENGTASVGQMQIRSDSLTNHFIIDMLAVQLTDLFF
jgi:hypothetical protein